MARKIRRIPFLQLKWILLKVYQMMAVHPIRQSQLWMKPPKKLYLPIWELNLHLCNLVPQVQNLQKGTIMRTLMLMGVAGLRKNTKSSLKDLKFSAKIGFKYKITLAQGLALKLVRMRKSSLGNFKGRKSSKNFLYSISSLSKRRNELSVAAKTNSLSNSLYQTMMMTMTSTALKTMNWKP